jgi:hypothetical protein
VFANPLHQAFGEDDQRRESQPSLEEWPVIRRGCGRIEIGLVEDLEGDLTAATTGRHANGAIGACERGKRDPEL